jgi:hypothetical protein
MTTVIIDGARYSVPDEVAEVVAIMQNNIIELQERVALAEIKDCQASGETLVIN